MTAAPPRRPRAAMVATVVRTHRLTPSMVRVVLGGPGLDSFRPSPCADSYVKAVFLPTEAPADLPRDAEGRVDLEALRELLGPQRPPRLRSYTVRGWDDGAREMTLDFVVHGDAGLAGPWAATAGPGDELLLLGPGGAWSPSADADWHLLVGDESALPAVAVSAEHLPAGSHAVAFVEVDGPDDEVPFGAPGLDVRWVHRAGRPVGEALVAAVRDLPWPDGVPHAFVHGEAGFVKELRAYLRIERDLPREQLSASGYWRLGTDDEGWRATKRDWAREVDEREAAAGLR